MKQRSPLAALLFLSILRPAYAGKAAAAGEDPLKAIDAAISASVKQARQTHPLFAVARASVQGKLVRLLSIRADQLDKPYLFSSTLERGTGANGIFSTMMDDTFLCSFRLSGDRVLFVRRQTEYRADPGTPESKAVAASIADGVLAVLPVVSKDEAKGDVVVFAEDLFLADPTHAETAVSAGYRGRAVAFHKEAGALERLDAYPKNLEVQSSLVYSAAAPDELIAITMRYSIAKLPDSPDFEPRPADPRVGYFTTDFQNLSRPELMQEKAPLEHLINRWNLRKKEPAAPVSEVEKPVVFWLEDTIPERYRPAIKAGILAWNGAFEAVGLRNALQVKEVDKDLSSQERKSFDPADISYNMVRWFVGEGSSFAVGPSRINPLTGEIFHASISVGDGMARYVGGLNLAGERTPASAGAARDEAALMNEARRQASAALGLLSARGEPTPEEAARYQDEFLIETMMHEVGHTLGLRHNFKGSASLQGPAEDGLHSASVMDYLPADIAPPGGAQGAYFQTKVGPYDAWAVEYGYKPLTAHKEGHAAALASIAARAETDTRLAYAPDEEADSMDPDAQHFDSGKGLDFPRARIALAKDLFSRLESDAADLDQDPARLAERFTAGVGAYFSAASAALPLIGGMRTKRGPGVQFEPVPAQQQRRALDFIDSDIFHADALSPSPQLLKRLGSGQFASDISNAPYPLAETVLQLQKTALASLYYRGTLRRLADGELYARDPGGRFTPEEMMDRVRRAIWTEVAGKTAAPISLYRRNLQREHLDTLRSVLQDAGMPADAQAAARRDVERIARDVRRGLPAAPDKATRLHLQELLRETKDILEPSLS